MLLNASIPAHEPEQVAAVLAEIVNGRVVPFPSAAGSFVVVPADGEGTHIEVHPASGDRPPARPELALAGAVRIGVRCGDRQLHRVARRAGWRSRTSLREGAYHVAELWIENRFLLEALTAEMQAEYRAFLAPPPALGGKAGHLDSRIATTGFISMCC